VSRYGITPNLSVAGCSYECYKDTVEPQCCPGYWGNDCIGEFQVIEEEFCFVLNCVFEFCFREDLWCQKSLKPDKYVPKVIVVYLSDYLTHLKWHLSFPSFCEGRCTEGIFWTDEFDRNYLCDCNGRKGKHGSSWRKKWKNITLILSFLLQKILKEC